MADNWAICDADDDGVLDRYADVTEAARALGTLLGDPSEAGDRYLRWVPEPCEVAGSRALGQIFGRA